MKQYLIKFISTDNKVFCLMFFYGNLKTLKEQLSYNGDSLITRINNMIIGYFPTTQITTSRVLHDELIKIKMTDTGFKIKLENAKYIPLQDLETE